MIKKEQIISLFSYMAVGALAILSAFWLSTAFLGESRSQEESNFPTEPPAEVLEVEPEADVPEDPAMSPGEATAPSLPMQGVSQTDVQVEVQSFLEPFIYDPKGRRDPFRPYTEVQLESAESSIPTGPIMPLQRFDLAELKLVGIIWDVHDPKAMFLDPNSRIYTVGKDERIGKNNGYVAAIREGEVVVIEAFKRREGETVYTPRVIRMER